MSTWPPRHLPVPVSSRLIWQWHAKSPLRNSPKSLRYWKRRREPGGSHAQSHLSFQRTGLPSPVRIATGNSWYSLSCAPQLAVSIGGAEAVLLSQFGERRFEDTEGNMRYDFSHRPLW